MIDEVDKSSNNQLFLDFLGMLRNKYLKQREPGQLTFHSVILAGVHDVKSLKAKIKKNAEPQFNSPWNIAVDFEVNLSFSDNEIQSMLLDYSNEQQVTLDIPYFAEQLFHLTSGYPFLVSQLCKIIHEKIIPAKETRYEWQPEDLEKAVQISLNTDNTNSESLTQNLESNPDLYELVFDIIMNGAEFSFNTGPHHSFWEDLRCFKRGDGITVCMSSVFIIIWLQNWKPPVKQSSIILPPGISTKGEKYIIELKIWRGESYHQDGIRQLCGYLDIHNESTGYLLIYDLRKESGLIGKNRLIETDGKTLFAAWV